MAFPSDPSGRGRAGLPPGIGAASRGRGVNRQVGRRPHHMLQTAQQQELQATKVANQKLLKKQMEELRVQV